MRAAVIVALVIAGTAPAVADELGSGGPLDLRGPAELQAGDRQPITISAGGEPAPELVVNVGVLSPPRRQGDRWQLEYTPPATRHPYLVLIAGRDRDGAVDWLAIPARGKAGLDLRSEPGAEVVVEIDGRRFGPVRTDRNGRARLTVSVPPGVDVARTIATDALGNVSHGSLPLSPPPFDRLLLLCPRGDDRAVAIAPLPASGLTVEAEVEPGAVAAIEPAAPGTYAVIVDAPDTAAEGDLMTARARIAGDPVSQASCTAPIATELPRRLRISAPGRWTAGDGPLEVVVEPVHAGHLPPRIVPVRLEADVGTIETLETAAGRVRARWVLPDELGDRDRATIRASADGVPGDQHTVTRRAAAPARILASLPGRMRADGSRATIPVEVRDRFGNRTAAPVTASAARGRTETEPGDPALVYYIAPELRRGGRDRVTIRAGEIEQTFDLALVAPPARLELTGALGYHSNLGKVAGAEVALRAGRGFLIAGHELGAGIEAGYLRGRDQRGNAGVETTADLAAVLVRSWYALPAGPLELRVGAGLGVLAGRVEAATASARSRAAGVWPALAGFVSAALPVGSGDLSAELGWLHATIDENGINGNPGGLRLTLGYRYRL